MKNSDPFINDIKQELDQASVDEATQAALIQARKQAMNPVTGKTHGPWRYVIPTLAVASLCAVTLAVILPSNTGPAPIEISQVDDIDILTSRDDLELYENLDFYLWLEQELDKPVS